MKPHLTHNSSRRRSRLLATAVVTLCIGLGAFASSASAILPTTSLTVSSVLPTTFTTFTTTFTTTLTTLPTTLTTLPTTLTTLTTLPTTLTTLPTTLTTLPTVLTTLTVLPTTSTTLGTTSSTTSTSTTSSTLPTTTGETTVPTTTLPTTTGTTLPTTTGGTTGGVPNPIQILPGPGGIPTLKFAAISNVNKSGVVQVVFDTSGGTTTGLLFVTKKLASQVGIAKAKTVKVGSGKVNAPAGRVAINLKLTKKARKAVRKKHKLKSTLQLQTVNNGKKSPVVRKTITLKG